MPSVSQRRICFLELDREAEAFLAHYGCVEDVMVVALSLEVQVYLKARQIPFVTSLPFFSKQSHADAIMRATELQLQLGRELKLGGKLIGNAYQNTALFIAQYWVNYLVFLVAVIDASVNQDRSRCVICPEPPTMIRAAIFGHGDARDYLRERDLRWD